MIIFKNDSSDAPYIRFKEIYSNARISNQESIEAVSISSFSNKINEVDARFVNLKIIDDKEFIFFSNYLSPKAIQFESHNQMVALFYWSSINTQIRIKGNIKKTSKDYNNQYFMHRSKEKNALAISSNQSTPIDSYSKVLQNYNTVLASEKLSECPEYWGGYSFTPYYFEFWEGHNSRLNKRDVYEMIDNEWHHYILQP